MDLMGRYCEDEKDEGNIVPILNNEHLDAFFLKIAIFYNPSSTVEKNPKTIPYYGGHIAFYVTALNGERVPATGVQLSNPGRSL